MGEDEKLTNDVEVEEEAKEETKEVAPKTDTSKIIKILLWVVGAVIVIALMFGISWLVASYLQEKKYQREQDIVVAPPPEALEHFDLPTFSVTTRDAEPHFAKISLSLAYEQNPELNAELVKRTVQIQHIINIILSGKKNEEMGSTEDKLGISEEIKSHVNVVLRSGKIVEVYFKEFVIN